MIAIPGGEKLVAKPGASEWQDVRDSSNAIADKLDEFCRGKVHPKQLSNVYFALSQSGIGAWIGKIPWRRKWQPTPVLLPGESHGGRHLVGYSPWGRKEWDTTERLHFHFQSQCWLFSFF